MKITYTGRQVELAPAQLKKLEAQFAKIGKLLDGKKEREAHVVLSLERHLHNAEATVNYYNHPLVGLGSDGDLFTAIHSAAEKLEKQAVKARTKWRDTKRVSAQRRPPEAADRSSRRGRSGAGGRVGASRPSRQSPSEAQADDASKRRSSRWTRPAITWSIAMPRPTA